MHRQTHRHMQTLTHDSCRIKGLILCSWQYRGEMKRLMLLCSNNVGFCHLNPLNLLFPLLVEWQTHMRAHTHTHSHTLSDDRLMCVCPHSRGLELVEQRKVLLCRQFLSALLVRHSLLVVSHKRSLVTVAPK